MEATTQNSVSIEDRVTVFCFLELQLIGVDPRKTMFANVDIQSSRLSAQSALAKAWKEGEIVHRMNIP